MPTFKLEDMDEDLPYGGDNDMYFRQWRLPSMKPILDEKLDRDFQEAVAKKDDMIRRKAERRQKHSEKFDKKFQDLVQKMSEATVTETKENVPFLRKPTELELKNARDQLEKEFAAPSSTARMAPFVARVRPRQNPIFGENMAGLKNIVLPPVSKPALTPKDPTFGAHETVFYPQTHDSFNLDNYNGSRPSFAFSGIHGATSTPVSKTTFPLFSSEIAEEGDDSVFESTQYVTAMESPIQKTSEMQKALEAQKADELRKLELKRAQEAEKAEKEQRKLEEQRAEEVRKAAQKAEAAARLAAENALKERQRREEEARRAEAKQAEEQRKEQFLAKMFQKVPDKAEENSGVSTQILSPNAQKLQGFSSIFGQKSTQNAGIFSQAPSGNVAPTEGKLAQKSAENDENQRVSTENPPSPQETQKAPTRPYVLFTNYISLLKTLLTDKKNYESSSDPHFRSLLKRTITEKVTVFTQRQTSSEARAEILEFFKSLLQKKEVRGFAVIGEAPKLQLETDEDVNYSVYCIVEKYISLAELDEELAPTISDLISRLSSTIRRVEKVFIVLMFNKSTLLRQNPEECHKKFVEHATAENSDEKAIEWNQEQALAILFFTVFAKNAFISSRGRKMVLSDELLWKYVQTSVAHVLEVPKASFILLQLITTCKPRLHADQDRWIEMLLTIESEILPELDADPFTGDEAIISQLRQMVTVLQG